MFQTFKDALTFNNNYSEKAKTKHGKGQKMGERNPVALNKV